MVRIASGSADHVRGAGASCVGCFSPCPRSVAARLRCLGQSGGNYSWIAARLLDAAAGVYPRRGHVDDR